MLVDARGRLFGRVNAIDAASAMLAVALVASMGAACAVIHTRAPIIGSVTPSTSAGRRAVSLQLDGSHFRPYLTAVVSKTGQGRPSVQEVAYLIATTTAVELRLPPLDPGTYDIRLFDGPDEVARRDMAFSIEPPSSHKGS